MSKDLWADIYRSVLKSLRRGVPLKLPPSVGQPIGASKALFGLPVVVVETRKGVVGGSFRGLYVSHSEYTVGGETVWVIRTGLFSIVAPFYDPETRKTVYYPFVENGFLTSIATSVLSWIRRGYDDYGRRFAGVFEAVGNFNYDVVECRKDDILFFDSITQGLLPVIIIDKYKLLRTGAPQELAEEFVALYYMNWELIKQKAEMEKTIRKLRTAYYIREAEYTTLKSDIDELRNILTTVVNENRRLREELTRRDVRLRFQEGALDTYKAMMDGYERMSNMLQDAMRRLAVIEERLRSTLAPPKALAEAKPEKAEEKAKTPPPSPRYVALRGGGGGERGAGT